MTRSAAPTVVLLSGSGTLRGLGVAARSRGLRLRRIEALRAEACLPSRASRPFPPDTPIDAIIVTSRRAVQPGLLRWTRGDGDTGTPQVWAAGPGTAASLRRLGVHRVQRGEGLGSDGIVARLGPGARTVVHVRSDAAGDVLARALRARGHRVAEVVAYRVRPVVSEVRHRMPEVRRASALVLTSPSALDSLRRAAGTAAVRELGRTKPVVVLGERTAQAARAAGFSRVSVAGTTAPKRFAHLLVRAVSHAPK